MYTASDNFCLCVTALIYAMWSALAVFSFRPTEKTGSGLFTSGTVAVCNLQYYTPCSPLLLLVGICLEDLFQLKQTTAVKPAEHSSTNHSTLWPWLERFLFMSVIFYCLQLSLAPKQNSFSAKDRLNIQFGMFKSEYIYDPVTDLLSYILLFFF